MTALDALLEGFGAGERRDFRGRWVKGDIVQVKGRGAAGGKYELTSVGPSHVTIKSLRSTGAETTMPIAHLEQGYTKVSSPPGDVPKVSMAQRRQEQADIETARRRAVDPSAAAAKPYKPPTEDALRQAAKHGLEFGATPAPDRHGGFKVGDVVTHETGSRGAGGHGPVTFTKQPGMSTVVGLQRNGNLRLKEPVHGTTHDVHHSHAQKVSPLHPSYRGKVVQDAYAAQKAELARQKAERARRSGRVLSESDVLGALLEGRV